MVIKEVLNRSDVLDENGNIDVDIDNPSTTSQNFDAVVESIAPVYDQLSNATAENGSIAQITGNGSDAAGFYVYNGESSTWAGPLGDGGSTTDTRSDVSDDGTLIVGSTSDINFSNNLSVTDDGDGSVTIDSTADEYTDEEVQDVVGSLVIGGTNASASYNDSENTLTISSTDTQLSSEEVQDIVGNFTTGGGATSVVYDDANNSLEISSINTQLSDSDVRTAVEGDTDVADLTGGLGSSGQIPETDGTSVSWVTREDNNTQAYSLAGSGSTTLSSGEGTADTGVSTNSSHYDVSINPGSADIAVSLDGSGTNYVIHMEEHTTSVGNPTVGWQLMESNL